MIGKNLHNVGLDIEFLDLTGKAQKEKIDKLDFKIKYFCSTADPIKRMKRQAPEGRKYLQVTYSSKDYYLQTQQ